MRADAGTPWLGLGLVLFITWSTATAQNEQRSQPSSLPAKHLTRKKEYLWKTGSWGSCYAPGGCGDGRRERPVWCSEPEGRTVLEFLCEASSKPERSKNCFTACRHHRDKLQWQVGQWGSCLPVYPSGTSAAEVPGMEVRIYTPLVPPTPADLDIDGGAPSADDPSEQQPIEEYLEAATNQGLESKESGSLGVMQRAVTCVLVSHESRATHRAVDEDNCFTVARKPDPVRLCRVPTPQDCIVSDFSDWSGTCGESCGSTNETRVRNVLVAPHNGGKLCPQLMESRACDPQTECLPGRAEPVRLGVSEYKLKVGEWRRCEAPTSLISADALYAPASSGPVSPGVSKQQQQQHPWDVTGHENYTYQPQVGYQTREVSCRDSKAAIVDISLCLGHKSEGTVPAPVRPCVVAQDCVVSQWSPWSRTQEGCVATSGEVRPELHSRKRDVVTLQQGDGQPCPHLIEERRVTDREQLQLCSDKYRWLASRWSPCVVTRADGGEHQQPVGCGGGVQLRSLSCVMRIGDRPVSPELCVTLEPLPTVQRCEVACPRDCEVAEWGEWGPCRPFDCPASANADAPTEGYRQRERTVVVTASRRGLECPAIREVQPCPQPTCFKWTPSEWGPCQLDPGVVRCGEGRRSRTVVCTTLDGGIVSDTLCARRELKPPQDEPCLHPCPFDCVLSPWSAWSPCSHACSSSRQAALRQRNRTVVAPAGPGGHPCPDPDEMLQIEACNLHSCHGYSWLALPWQACEVQNSTAVLAVLLQQASAEEEGEGGVSEGVEDTGEAACGRGVQRREVWCMEANERKVHDWKCRPLNKPATLRVCSAPCPQDCEVSPWSEWSECPQECVADDSNEVRERSGPQMAPTQLRHRVMLRVPAGGGTECPSLEELRPCPLSAARCRRHTWWSGEWSQCQLPANVECGQGYRTRPVACLLNSRARVDPSGCMQEGGIVPSMAQPCYVSCDFPCVLSEWGTWSPCQQACGGVSMRRRTLIGLAATRPACRDTRRFPLAQSRTCPCSVFESRPEGPWSSCVLDLDAAPEETANGRVTSTTLCGAGRRFRARSCRDKAGNIVEPSRCGETGVEEEPCLISCPADCSLGEWSTWGECSSPCGPGLQTRNRKLLRPALNGGRPCGATTQTKVCDTPCSQFQWAVSGWEDCRLIRADQQQGCGTGDQSRTVRCVHESPHQAAREVADKMCDLTRQPEDETACHVTCPGECVVSPWSEWSVCSSPCHPASERQRTRSVLRPPAAHITSRCPPLIEAQSCVLNETCFTYEWRATGWSSCLPLGGSPCGEGVESRGVYCRRSDDRTVDDVMCAGQHRPNPVEKWCYVDCPVDCEVSEWSAWNNSDCECGGAGSTMRRVRHISTNPSEMGRPCPIELIQQKPCPSIPCFSWHRSDWSKCDLHGAMCGHGTVTRNVTCRRELSGTPEQPDELPIATDEDLCLGSTRHLPPFFRERPFLEVALDLKREDACYVPCRGDCEVAEWSHWSHCHRNCRDGEMGGYQTRSRAVLQPPRQGGEPCPAALYETRPCFSGPCLTFDWAVRDGDIVCQRSDGTQVTGGCDGRPRPCVKPCTISNSECSREGVCACVPGFAPRYNDQSVVRRLRACVPMSSPAAAAAPGAQAAVDSSGHPSPPEDGELKARYYYPKDDEISIWMFAMIGIGCVFIVFVAVSIYLMCHSSANANSRLQPQTMTVRQTQRTEAKP